MTKIHTIEETLYAILPIHMQEYNRKRKIVLLNCASDRSYYKEICNVYCIAMLRYHYGIGSYLSHLYVYNMGFNKRTMFYFRHQAFETFSITSIYQYINKLTYAGHMACLRKKFEAHTYWSISYMHRYPCRGQRRRSNACTAKRLHLWSQFNPVVHKKKESIKIKKKPKAKQKKAQPKNKKKRRK